MFAREIAAPSGASRPYLVFLQGGPGAEAPRPLTWTSPPWIEWALRAFRVILLDQRGTGRSSPIGANALQGRSAEEQADYLKHFRADSIVQDAELIREALGIARWTILGQSFGGFCVLNYLSFSPQGLDGALISGGLPPIMRPIDDIYRATYARLLSKVDQYYVRYPDDATRMREIQDWLCNDDVRLPSGDQLTPRRLRQLGWWLGMADGFEKLHYILELPPGSPAFLHDVEHALPFARNPLYAVIHESCYADGCATRWAASRMLEYDDPLLFTGEHVFPWMFEEYGQLEPLRIAAELLSEHEWGRLYDEEQLRVNDVPVSAVIYCDDIYCERTFSEETVSAIRGLRPWITNEYAHDGLEASGVHVLSRLVDLCR